MRRILALSMPRRCKATFNHAEFRDLLAHSHSITEDEKACIMESIGHTSQHDMDEFIRVLREERAHFADINRRYDEQMEARLPVH